MSFGSGSPKVETMRLSNPITAKLSKSELPKTVKEMVKKEMESLFAEPSES